MAKAKSPDIDLDRLCTAMRYSRRSLERFRVNRREAVRQYVGARWSEDGSKEKVPVNLVGLYTSIISRSLIAKNPRVMISTFDRDAKSVVAAMQTWANLQIEAMCLGQTLQKVVVDALFSVGVCKVALATPQDASVAGWNLPAGQPFAEKVDLDDFVFDAHARDFAQAGFVGHRYRVPLDAVRDSSVFSAARKKVSPAEDRRYNQEGDERLSVMQRGYYGDTEEYEDFVDLWEVYLPRQRKVLTLVDDGGGAAAAPDGRALRVQEWVGPDTGPYHFLGYGTVPDNAMPKGPVQDLIELHETVNRLYRKLMRQAERQKEVLGVRSAASDDASRTIETNDGEAFRCDNPEGLKPLTFGGPSQQNMAMAIHLKDLFSWLGGNLDMLGGLSPQSKTLGQDQMLAQNASRTVADMQDTTVGFTADVLKSLCWYWWHHPQQTLKTTHQIPGLPDLTVNRRVTPDQRRQFRWDDLDAKVDPYSLQHTTPQARAQQLNQMVQTVITPLLPLLQQQGVMFDVNAYLAKMSAYMDMPDLPEIVTIQQPPQEEGGTGYGGGGDDAPSMPGQTTRNYVRRSLGQDSPQNRNAAMVNAAMSGGAGGGRPEAAQ